ncbi:MAG TPA: site-2 protease family protein [Fibrobacteria bacterium]|nr:site-2 protease family protein [Fibrobacteria bacterium]
MNAQWTSLLWQIPVGLAVLLSLQFLFVVGQLLVAHRIGVKVRSVNFGVGQLLIGLKVRGTTYSFFMIPFGSSLLLGDDHPAFRLLQGLDEGKQVTKWDELRIFGGGVCSLVVFAFVLAWLITFFASPYPYRARVVSFVEEKSYAFYSGLKNGDIVRSGSGKTVLDNNEFFSLPFGFKSESLFIQREDGKWDFVGFPQCSSSEGGCDLNKMGVVLSDSLILLTSGYDVRYNALRSAGLALSEIKEFLVLPFRVLRIPLCRSNVGGVEMARIYGVGIVTTERYSGWKLIAVFTEIFAVQLAAINVLGYLAVLLWRKIG